MPRNSVSSVYGGTCRAARLQYGGRYVFRTVLWERLVEDMFLRKVLYSMYIQLSYSVALGRCVLELLCAHLVDDVFAYSTV